MVGRLRDSVCLGCKKWCVGHHWFQTTGKTNKMQTLDIAGAAAAPHTVSAVYEV
jgi:hypothetical protein